MARTNTSHSSTPFLQSLFLVAISIIVLPASLLALFYNYAALVLRPQNELRQHVKRSTRFRPRKVLITGISTPAGLRIARALYHTGHDVVGVERGRYSILNHARWSNAVSKLYCIALPRGRNVDHKYAESLFRIIVRERAALWIDCSTGTSALTQAGAKVIVEERSACVCFVPKLEHVQQLQTSQGFQQMAKKLGLQGPEAYFVRSRNDIYNVLGGSHGKKYLLSSPNGTDEPATQTILPRRSVSQTYSDVARLKLTMGNPWTLEQYMEGLPRFTACAIVVRGKITAFTASSVVEKGAFIAIDVKSGLSEAMRQYMQKFAEAVKPELSSHLTMEFCLDENATEAGVVQQILPLGARLAPHETLLLFDGKRGSMDLTKAYIGIISTATTELDAYTGLPLNDPTSDILVPTEPEIGVYCLATDLRKLVVDPLLQLLSLRSSVLALARSWVVFLQHLVAWHETLYEFSDPLPLFWYTHVSAPCELISEAATELWSRGRTGFGRRTGSREQRNGGKLLNGH